MKSCENCLSAYVYKPERGEGELARTGEWHSS